MPPPALGGLCPPGRNASRLLASCLAWRSASPRWAAGLIARAGLPSQCPCAASFFFSCSFFYGKGSPPFSCLPSTSGKHEKFPPALKVRYAAKCYINGGARTAALRRSSSLRPSSVSFFWLVCLPEKRNTSGLLRPHSLPTPPIKLVFSPL